jgi:hypothetical protein
MDGLTNPTEGAQRASPGQQEQFDLLLGRSRQLMAKAGEEWLSALKAAPVQAAVTLGTTTLRSVAMMSQQAGQPVDPSVLLNVGVQLVKDTAAIANTAGFVSDEQLPAFLKDVLSQSIMEYMQADAKDGLMSPEAKQQAQGMLAKMQRGDGADAEGAADMTGEAMAAQGGQPMAAEGEGYGPGPDNLPAYESVEAPSVEQQEGMEEDPTAPGMLAQMQRRGVQR